MIPFEWPFMHRTVAEMDAVRADWLRRFGFTDDDQQQAPRAEDEQFGAISDRVHKGGE